MKYIILKDFRDKHTGESYKEGAIKEFTQKRVKEILKVDKLIEEYKAEETEEK